MLYFTKGGGSDMEIDKDLRTGVLLDIYGGLLTQRQREIMTMYFNDDLSLSEIAEQYGITRQGVHDAIKRGAESLAEYDDILHLDEENKRRRAQLLEFKAQALEALEECRKVTFGRNIAMKVIALLENLDSKLAEYEPDEQEKL